MKSENKFLLGLDIGGTKCAVSAGASDGNKIELLGRAQTETKASPRVTLEELAPHIDNFLHLHRCECVGISCGGPLDSVSGKILQPPNLYGWHGFNIVEYLRERYGLRSRLENDANACALAEWRFGAGKGARNMVFLTFGTGLGAGLILGGKLYGGANGNAGEVGHIRLERSGPRGYGKNGSFEGFCSGGGIARLAEIMGKRERELPEFVRAAEGFANVTAKSLYEAAECGCRFAKKIFRKSGDMLGRGLSVIIDMLNPEAIVLGGVYMRARKFMENAMLRAVKREALGCAVEVCRILPAALGENVGDYAALSVAEAFISGELEE